jgi:hypothetical protein
MHLSSVLPETGLVAMKVLIKQRVLAELVPLEALTSQREQPYMGLK